MAPKLYFWILRFALILGLGTWIWVLFNLDPENSGLIVWILFYGAFFVFLGGFFMSFFTWLNRDLQGEQYSKESLVYGARQGLLLSFLIVALLFFQQKEILLWWDGLLLVAGIFLVELYFLSRRK